MAQAASQPSAADSRGTKGGADENEKLVRVIQETATFKILEKLDELLPGITRQSVDEAIVHAMHSDEVVIPRRQASSTPAKRPKAGGVCAAVWSELDKLHQRMKTPPQLADIQKIGDRKHWNPNNTRVEFYAWRKAHGISGRQPAAGQSAH